MFDTLTDLVEYYKRKGIEEISGNWVYFKQVKRLLEIRIFFSFKWFPQTKHFWWSSNCVILILIYFLSHITPPE